MSQHWQFSIVMACVLFAAWQLGRMIWTGLFQTETKGCGGGCHSCPSNGPAQTPLVQLDLFDTRPNSPKRNLL